MTASRYRLRFECFQAHLLGSVRLFGLAFAFMMLIGQPLNGAGPDLAMPIDVSSARPLAAAADQLQRYFGIAVSYEDPPFSHPDDLRPSATKPKGEGAVIMVPAGQGLRMSLGYESGGSVMLDPVTILDTLVQLYADEDQPGRFQVEQRGAILCITPTHMRQGEGALAAVTPLLDTSISLSIAPRQAILALEEIRNQVSAATGVSVGLGMVPANLLTGSTVTVGGNNLAARDFLAQLSEELSVPVTWRLLWDANLNQYYLNLEAVGHRRSNLLTYQPFNPQAVSPGASSGQSSKN